MKTLLNQKFSRRNLVRGAGLSVLGAGLGMTNKALAQDMMAAELPSAFQRLSVGDATVTVMQEALFNLPVAAFGGGVEESDVAELLTNYNLPTDGVAASVNVIVVDTGAERILLDTGTGNTTLAGLHAIGINAEDITKVVISHWHGDHVGGISTEGTLNFPNASYHFPEVDWNFLQEADNDGARGSLAKLQPAQDAGKLELYTTGELLTGLTAVATPGHTPGHHAFMVSSGSDSFMYTADTANNHVTALIHPEWGFGFDADAAQAAETRRALLDQLATDGTHMIAYHFPFPGAGYITKASEGFRFTAGI